MDNNNNFDTQKKKVIVKRKLNINAIIILVSILMILSLIPIWMFVFGSDDESSNSDNQNTNNNIIEEDEEVIEDEPLTEMEVMQKELSFFKEENIDRYNAYKEKNPDLDLETVIVYVNIGLDRDFYTDISSSPNQYTNTVLSNKYYSLPEDYVPKNLQSIDSKYSSGNRQMESEAALAFNELARDAKLEGYTIRAVSTYRSYDYQKNLYSNYAKSDGVEKADTYSARAGHSEHQTGLAVDVDNANKSYTSFGSTNEFTWMKENAYKYGFILRYTKENEFITGYKDEPWHYRYVGVEIATYIQNNPMTYEEYYVRFLDN